MTRPQPVILVPPSEGKATGGDGPAWAAGQMVDRKLDRHRREVLRAAKAAGATPRRAGTLPAMQRYTGVLYQELAWATLPAAARRRGNEQLRTVSGLVGAGGAHRSVPPYRLKMSASLDGLGRLSTWWKPRLAPVLADLTRRACGLGPAPQRARGGHGLGRHDPGRRVTIRFLDAEGKTVSHWNKLLKGSLVRWLLTEQPRRSRGARLVPPPARLPASTAGARTSTATLPTVVLRAAS